MRHVIHTKCTHVYESAPSAIRAGTNCKHSMVTNAFPKWSRQLSLGFRDGSLWGRAHSRNQLLSRSSTRNRARQGPVLLYLATTIIWLLAAVGGWAALALASVFDSELCQIERCWKIFSCMVASPWFCWRFSCSSRSSIRQAPIPERKYEKQSSSWTELISCSGVCIASELMCWLQCCILWIGKLKRFL